MDTKYKVLIDHFEKYGYVVIPKAVSREQIDAFWDDVEKNILNNSDLTFALHEKILKNSELRGS